MIRPKEPSKSMAVEIIPLLLVRVGKKHLTAQRGCVAGVTICKGLDEGGGGWGRGETRLATHGAEAKVFVLDKRQSCRSPLVTGESPVAPKRFRSN